MKEITKAGIGPIVRIRLQPRLLSRLQNHHSNSILISRTSTKTRNLYIRPVNLVINIHHVIQLRMPKHLISILNRQWARKSLRYQESSQGPRVGCSRSQGRALSRWHLIKRETHPTNSRIICKRPKLQPRKLSISLRLHKIHRSIKYHSSRELMRRKITNWSIMGDIMLTYILQQHQPSIYSSHSTITSILLKSSKWPLTQWGKTCSHQTCFQAKWTQLRHQTWARMVILISIDQLSRSSKTPKHSILTHLYQGNVINPIYQSHLYSNKMPIITQPNRYK